MTQVPDPSRTPIEPPARPPTPAPGASPSGPGRSAPGAAFDPTASLPPDARWMAALEAAPAPCRHCEPATAPIPPLAFALQPIVDIATRSVFAHEALVRGTEGQGAGHVLSQIHEGNRYAFDQACRQVAIETAAGLGLSERLSINFMPNAIYKPEACIRATLAAARRFGLPLDRIMFEFTEDERVADPQRLVEIVTAYRRLGFVTAIDDFGAGYSNLDLLAAFAPDFIKIDMALVRDIDRRPRSRAVVGGLLRMCEELRVGVIAEGIETAGERDALADLGVRLMQGFFFARPAFRARADVPDTAWQH